MPPKRNQTARETTEKPRTEAEKRTAIAEINARHQAGELSAKTAQAQIDALNGVTRTVDRAGNVTVTDANVAQADATGTGADAGATDAETSSAGQ